MDGHSLLAELRALDATQKAPALALSGFTQPKDIDKSMKAGFVAHLKKTADL
ncbi:hypothetical protein [Undibacterium sp.]|uniref:hypothetical protein n=1 Tax=Undibacterium sp. TaxID=1914977 RepID=UPI00374DA2CF